MTDNSAKTIKPTTTGTDDFICGATARRSRPSPLMSEATDVRLGTILHAEAMDAFHLEKARWAELLDRLG